MITRRSVLLGGLGAGAGLALGGCSTYALTGTMRSGSFVSRLRGGVDTGWSVLYPPGAARAHLPVLVTLHGRSGSHRNITADLHLDKYLAKAVAAGVPPFAIASVDGGDHDYWHPRQGTDPAGMVVHEFLPLLARLGLRTRHFGLYGWSMGGYGALYLAERLSHRRVAVLVAESPAIWHHSWQSAVGAFDDAQDWQRHDIWPRLSALRGIPTRIDCGDADGFAPVTRDLRAAIHPTPAGGIAPGGHDSTFWRSQATASMRFAGTQFAQAN